MLLIWDLKKAANKFSTEYKFIKNPKIGFLVGLWCFAFTAFACVMGMFPTNVDAFSGEWIFRVALNVMTPIILMGLGLILPMIAKKTNNKEKIS